jgi:ArsR family transcriptional regulator
MNGGSDNRATHAVCSAIVIDADAVARVRAGLANDERTAKTTAIFSALADSTRFRILDALSHEELCVCDLASVCGISQSGVSHQLRVLRDLGLIAFTRDGTRAVYRLADNHVRTLIAQGLEHADESGADQ